jgi:hypothetical protein
VARIKRHLGKSSGARIEAFLSCVKREEKTQPRYPIQGGNMDAHVLLVLVFAQTLWDVVKSGVGRIFTTDFRSNPFLQIETKIINSHPTLDQTFVKQSLF